MGRTSGRTCDPCRWVGLTTLGLLAALAVSVATNQEAGAQSARTRKAKPKPSSAKHHEEAPPSSTKHPNEEAPPSAPLPPPEMETVKLADGSEVEVEKRGETFAARDYEPPIDIQDRRVQVIFDSGRDRVFRTSFAMAVDSEGGKLYFCEGLPQPPNPPNAEGHPSGRILRSNLDGTKVQILATDRSYPRNLVLDQARGRLYWLEGSGLSIHTLQSARLDGKDETTLSRGLHQPNALTLDTERGHLYYWENSRLVRINVDGTDEEVVTDNYRIARPDFATSGTTPPTTGSLPRSGRRLALVRRDGSHPKGLRRVLGIRQFAFDDAHQKFYYANSSLELARSNTDGTQIEPLVAAPRISVDGFSRRIGCVALDLPHGQIYWSGSRDRGDMNVTLCRTALRALSVPTDRPSPPQISAIAPIEQAAGGEITLNGSDLARTVAVAFLDDATGAHVSAKFVPKGDDRLSVIVPG